MTTSPPLIFYTDDDQEFQHLFRKAMGNIAPSFQIKFFPNREELRAGLEELYLRRNLLPNLIVLDIKMIIKKKTLITLNKKHLYQQIPIVLLSSERFFESKTKALAMGANAFLIKPIFYEEIEELVWQLDNHWARLFSQLRQLDEGGGG